MNFKCISFAAVMATAMNVTASADNFWLSGHIKGLPDSVKISLVDIEDPNGKTTRIASSSPQNGYFSLSGDIKSPTMTQLIFSRRNGKDGKYRKDFYANMMVDPSDLRIETTLDFDSLLNLYIADHHLKAVGSEITGEYNEFAAAIKDAELKEREISYLSANKYFESNGDNDTVRKYDALKKKEEMNLLAAKQDFISRHPEYNISAFVTQQELTNIFKYSEDEISAMLERVRTCPDTARVNKVERMGKFAKRYAMHMECPQFEATSPDGKVVDFKANLIPGKLTFIDFWASWCGPCRAAIPHVKELHKKYGDRMDVYSISVDENDKAWRKAMEKEKMEWQQYHLAGNEQMGKGAQAFFIQSIPRLILLDGNGRIICSTNSPNEITDAIEKNLAQ